MAYLSKEELEKIGFKSVGEEVYVSDKASINFIFSAVDIGPGSI